MKMLLKEIRKQTAVGTWRLEVFSSSSGFKKKYSNVSLKLLGFEMRAHYIAQLGLKVEIFLPQLELQGYAKESLCISLLSIIITKHLK